MHRPLLAVAAALVVLVSGCSEQTGGSPVAEGDTTGGPTLTQPSQETTEPTETSEPSGGGLDDVDPCGLVSAEDLATLGLTGGEGKTLGEARVCRYRFEGPTLNESFTVSVEVFDSRGLADIVGTDVKQLPKIGSHDASSFTGPTGGCGVSIGVGADARVDNTAVGGALQQGCEIAAQLAAHVEPKLP